MRVLAMLASRLAWMPVTIVGLALLVFTISHVVPADPAALIAGEHASPEQVAALRKQYGLDRPLPEQFVHYLGALATGDMGTSFFTQRPVSEELLTRVAATFELAVYAILAACALGIPLGVMSALRRNSLIDHVVRIVTIAGLAIAAFWLAILLQLLFSMVFDVLPVRGRLAGWGPEPLTGFLTVDAVIRGDWEGLADAMRHLVLPVTTLALPATAVIARFTRAGVLNIIASNFVFYQTAMGFPRRRIVWKYILRGALIGTLTQIGIIFGNLLAGAVVVEAVFDWPGIGTFAVNSILQSDYNSIMGFTIFTGIVFIIVNFAVDVGQTLLDPRGR